MYNVSRATSLFLISPKKQKYITPRAVPLTKTQIIYSNRAQFKINNPQENKCPTVSNQTTWQHPIIM